MQMVNRAMGGRRGAAGMGTPAGGRPVGGVGGATRGRRAQDEAIGRGVRGLLRRFR
jgi:hypothetical protein